MLLAALFGAIASVVIQIGAEHISPDTLGDSVNRILTIILPFCIPALLLGIHLPVGIRLKKVRRLIASWDGEDETVADSLEDTIAKLLLCTSCAFYLSMFFVGALLTLNLYYEVYFAKAMGISLSVILAFLVEITVLTAQQKICVDLTKQMNPEKKGSVYDINFEKKWYASLDEAEKIAVGQCAYASHKAVNLACSIIWLLLVLLAIAMPVGILPFLIPIAIMLVSNISFVMADLKSRKARD